MYIHVSPNHYIPNMHSYHVFDGEYRKLAQVQYTSEPKYINTEALNGLQSPKIIML